MLMSIDTFTSIYLSFYLSIYLFAYLIYLSFFYLLGICMDNLEYCSKLKFLYVEIFGDMSTYVWGSVDFYITVLVATIAFFLRIYVHFLSQYLYLQVSILCS